MSLGERVCTGALSALCAATAVFAGYGVDVSLSEVFRHTASTGNMVLGTASTLACIGLGAMATVGAVYMGRETIAPDIL